MQEQVAYLREGVVVCRCRTLVVTWQRAKKKKLNRLVGFARERRSQFLVIVALYMSNEKEKKQ